MRAACRVHHEFARAACVSQHEFVSSTPRGQPTLRECTWSAWWDNEFDKNCYTPDASSAGHLSCRQQHLLQRNHRDQKSVLHQAPATEEFQESQLRHEEELQKDQHSLLHHLLLQRRQPVERSRNTGSNIGVPLVQLTIHVSGVARAPEVS